MTKIKEIEMFELGESKEKSTTPWSSTILISRITTDDGVVGYGEAPTTLMTLPVLEQMREISRIIKNKDPTELNQIFTDVYRHSFYMSSSMETVSAFSSFEIAIMDIFGKMYGLPVYKMLGGKLRDKLRIYANGWYSDCVSPEDFIKKAKHISKLGINAIKFDPFADAYNTIDTEHIEHAESVVKGLRTEFKKMDLLIEFHGRFNANPAIKAATPLLKFNPLFMEEPVHPDQFEGLLRFRNRVDTQIALGERILNKNLFANYLTNDLVDVVQPDVTNCGGISEGKRIADLANTFGVDVAFHNAFGPIQTAATINIDYTIPNFLIQESFDNSWPEWKKKLLKSGYEIEDGHYKLSGGNGLGIKVNERILEEFTISGMETFNKNEPTWTIEGTFKKLNGKNQ